MTTEKETLSIASTDHAHDVKFIERVKSFAIGEDSPDINNRQRDGATAVIDLALEFEKFDKESTPENIAKVLGSLSDIQVRDFALGSHNASSFTTYWQMWLYLLQIAPDGFVAPVACLFASMAYESGDIALAYRALDRASADQPQYSLTILLRRVFGSGWPAAAFAAMRCELHPKVTAGIFD
jgi:hypothetical protein